MESYSEDLKNLAFTIWDYSELKFHELKSSQAQIEVLQKYGFAVTKNVAGIETAFTASFGNDSGPQIGYLGEFDALSGLSQVADCPERMEREKGGCGHGCGHHLLGTASIGAAIQLKAYMEANNVDGRVIYFGCPGEEGGSGKAFMAKYGVFDGLDLALTWHPFNENAIFVGSMLANKQVYVRFKGVGSHAAATPHLGRSALDALEILHIGINFLREHMRSIERIHYAITDGGGVSPNVVQPYAEGIYLIRSDTTENVSRLYERFEKIVQGAALMTETQAEIVFDKACSNVVPNTVLERVLYESFKKLGCAEYTAEEKAYAKQFRDQYPDDNIYSEQILSLVADPQAEIRYLKDHLLYERIAPYAPSNAVGMGSSDVGDVSNVVPTSQIITACFAIGTVGHSWQEVAQGKSSIALKGMFKAADVLADAGKTLLNNPALIAEAKQELAQRQQHKGFVSPIPDGAMPRIR